MPHWIGSPAVRGILHYENSGGKKINSRNSVKIEAVTGRCARSIPRTNRTPRLASRSGGKIFPIIKMFRATASRRCGKEKSRTLQEKPSHDEEPYDGWKADREPGASTSKRSLPPEARSRRSDSARGFCFHGRRARQKFSKIYDRIAMGAMVIWRY